MSEKPWTFDRWFAAQPVDHESFSSEAIRLAREAYKAGDTSATLSRLAVELERRAAINPHAGYPKTAYEDAAKLLRAEISKGATA